MASEAITASNHLVVNSFSTITSLFSDLIVGAIIYKARATSRKLFFANASSKAPGLGDCTIAAAFFDLYQSIIFLKDSSTESCGLPSSRQELARADSFPENLKTQSPRFSFSLGTQVFSESRSKSRDPISGSITLAAKIFPVTIS